MKRSGIYAIENKVNGKKYIGSAVNSPNRWLTHLSQLRRGIHHNRHLQAAWNKYGEASFEFKLLQVVDDKNCLVEEEQKWIDKYWTEGKLYNLSPTAGSILGFRHDPEVMSRRKKVRYWLGKSPSAEIRAKLSVALKGVAKSEKTKQRMSIARKKQKPPRLGFVTREETKEAIRKHHLEHGVNQGEKSAKAVLKEEQVKKIRQLLAEGQSSASCARMFSVSPGTIQAIKEGRSWKHIL